MNLKIGFEIHQQLDTHKLFCGCPSLFREDKPDILVERKLRPTQSELGEIDKAALEEFLKRKSFLYEGYSDTTCLVELDEEPPHTPNEEAIDIALEIAVLLNADIVDEIHFMRKVVIDGSNTSGFQRTAIIALDGYIKTRSGKVAVPTVCLEEEAARKIAEEDKKIIYRLDRLGIPLIEITTAPEITSPEQAKEVAVKIGEILRATGKVKRGIGTIRQDINVSIEGGARVEIKGVQELSQIPAIIENEIKRQEMLIGVKKQLEKVSRPAFQIYEVSDIFQTGGAVFALKLPGFKGLLKNKLDQEFAQYTKISADVRRIFHSDELGDWISQREFSEIIKKLQLKENDAFVLVMEKKEIAEKALEVIFNRAKLAFNGIPEETRAANTDGTSSYMRPLPGAARMYPETDIPPVAIAKERLKRITSKLPEIFEDKIKRFVKEYKLSKELASQLVKSEHCKFFEEAIKTGINPSIAANTLLGTIKELKREGFGTEKIPYERLIEIFMLVADKKLAKEAIPEILKVLAEKPEKKVVDVIQSLGLKTFGEKEIAEIINAILKERQEFVKQKRMEAAKPLMGLVMKEIRGKIDGKLVNEILKRELKKFLKGL